MGTVYVVIIENRHSGVGVKVFAESEPAIASARSLATKLDRHGTPDERMTHGMRQAGWLYYGRYSEESDSVYVVPAEVNDA